MWELTRVAESIEVFGDAARGLRMERIRIEQLDEKEYNVLDPGCVCEFMGTAHITPADWRTR